MHRLLDHRSDLNLHSLVNKAAEGVLAKAEVGHARERTRRGYDSHVEPAMEGW